MLNYLKAFFKKENLKRNIRSLTLLLVGTFIVSAGNAFFLIPFSIISGGVSGITILTSEFIAPDIMSYILNWALFVLGLILLGFKFTISSLISTIFYPIFISIFLRTSILPEFLNVLLGEGSGFVLENGIITNLSQLSQLSIVDGGFLLIIGLLGGMTVGVGCSITFHGGGSTGGIDILTFIVSKFTGIKESIPFFLFDGGIVLIGIIIDLTKGNTIALIGGLVGIISAFMCSLMVEIIYSGQTSAYCVDIVTNKVDEICQFSIKELDRSATVSKVVGAYSKEEKTMVRIVFSRRDYNKVRNGIAKIDPKAFCTFYQTLFTGGEGFENININNSERYLKSLKKKIKAKNKVETQEKDVVSNDNLENSQDNHERTYWRPANCYKRISKRTK